MYKKILLIPLVLLVCRCFSQSGIKVEPDTVRILNSELVIKNNTKNVNGYLYNTGGGTTTFKKFGKSIQFKVGNAGAPTQGDTVYQNDDLKNYFIKVLRNGLLQYRDITQGVKISDTAGKITFYPALSNNDVIYIESVYGVDFSMNGSGVTTSNAGTSVFKLNAGANDNGNKTFTLRWNTNAKTLYISPRIVGIGSSTLAGYGLTSPDRLGDKISTWIANNTSGGTWTNLAVAGYSSTDILPVAKGGTLGHNIETALGLYPDFIFVSLPSNDPAVGLTVNKSISNLKLVDSLAIAQGIVIFFETTQPRTSLNTTQQGMLKQLADSIRSNWPTRYVEGFKDVYDTTTTGAILTQYAQADGTHLTSEGNQFIADHLFERWMDYFTAIKDIKSYQIDSSLDKSVWASFRTEADGNITKNSYPRYNESIQYFRVKATKKDGTVTSYSNVVMLDSLVSAPIPGVNDYTYRLLTDLGGDGVNTLNGSDQADGKPTPSPDGNGHYWNNWYGIGGVTGFADGSVITDMKTTANDLTSMSMKIIGLPTGTFGTSNTKSINYNGFTVASGDYPWQALYDNMFIHSSNNPDGVILRIKGLSKDNKYYIKLWGARLDDGTATRTLQAKLGNETWATAQSVETKYPTTGTPNYTQAVTFNNITGLDSLDINLRTGGTSTFAHVSLVDIGVVGSLPLIPQLRLRDTTTTLSTIKLTAVPINGANIASYQWTQVSGPNTATLTSSTSAAVNISALTNGVFVFKVAATGTDGIILNATSTVQVFPNDNGKKTMRVYFSKTAANLIPGWLNMFGATAGNHIVMTDPTTSWIVDNVSESTTYWSSYAGNSSSNTDGSTTGNNSGVIPDIALQGLWYNYSLKYTSGMDNLIVKGLTPGKTYTVKLYASRNSSTATAPRYGCWRVNGGSEQLQNALGNTTLETKVENVSPDNSGTLKLSVHAPTSSTYGNFSYINALIVQEN